MDLANVGELQDALEAQKARHLHVVLDLTPLRQPSRAHRPRPSTDHAQDHPNQPCRALTIDRPNASRKPTDSRPLLPRSRLVRRYGRTPRGDAPRA